MKNKYYEFATLILVLSVVLMAATYIWYMVNKSHQLERLVDAQVQEYEARAANVGKPQIIEQRYYSPNDL